ncbi:MAG: Ig-like domain-containing protein, partial [Candidatus Hydrogenedentota bacterium]
MRTVQLSRVLGSFVLVGVIAPFAFANSPQIVIFNGRYPTTVGQANQASGCTLCHAAVPALNSYGLAFKNSPAGPDSTNGLAQIEFVDTDGDNFTNLHEILLFKFPGNVANFPAAANTAPVLNAVGNKTLNEGQTLNFQVTTTDDVAGLAPLFSATNLPTGATFTDNRNSTATFNWVTDFADGGVYSGIQITSNDGLLSDSETITITVDDINEAPNMGAVQNQVAYVESLLQFNVSATDPESAPLTLSAMNLPAGAAFLDNGDGTGTFTWAPVENDIGTYPDVTFTAADDAAQTDDVTIVVFVTASPKLVFSQPSVLNTSGAADDVIDYRADLANDGAGNWVAVWYISDTGLVMAARSSDNGMTWSDP